MRDLRNLKHLKTLEKLFTKHYQNLGTNIHLSFSWLPVKQVVKLSGQGGWGRRPGSRRQVTRSLQRRRILGRRNLVRVRNIVVAAIFDFMTVEDWEESE